MFLPLQSHKIQCNKIAKLNLGNLYLGDHWVHVGFRRGSSQSGELLINVG